MNMAPTFDTEGNTITILSKNSHLRKAILQLLGYASCHSSAYIRLMLGMSSVRWIRGTLYHSMCLSRILLHEYSSGLWNYIWRIRLLPLHYFQTVWNKVWRRKDCYDDNIMHPVSCCISYASHLRIRLSLEYSGVFP